MKVHEVYKRDNDPQCLDEVIRNYLATHTTHVEPVESYCEEECDNDEFLLQKEFEDEFSKFYEKTSVGEQRIASTHMEKMEHTDQNCENAYMDNEPLFLMSFLLKSMITMMRKHVLRILSLEFPLRKQNLI